MKSTLKWFLCLSLFIMSNELQAQDGQDSLLWVIETIDDNEYIGRIVYRDSEVVRVVTQTIGEITIKMKDVKSIEKVKTEQMVNGTFWFENPHSTRYFLGPNGYGLRKGEGYYQNTWLFFNQVSYGATDNFSIGLGTFPLFLLGQPDATPIWLTPKFSFPVKADKINIGAGALVGGVIGQEEIAGIAYGTATFGSRDKNVSFSMGYGFVDGNWADTPIFTVSGMYRTGKRGFFLTENYFAKVDGETFGVLMVGGRYIFKRLALDYGGLIPFGSGVDTLIALPWLGLNIPFGNKRKAE